MFLCIRFVVITKNNDHQNYADVMNLKDLTMIELRLQGNKGHYTYEISDTISPEHQTVFNEQTPETFSFGEVNSISQYGNITSNIKPPKPLFNNFPSYPDKLRSERIEGVVLIEIGILENGHIGYGKIISSPHPLLSKLVLEWAKKINFRPARDQNGTPMACRLRIPLKFKLD